MDGRTDRQKDWCTAGCVGGDRWTEKLTYWRIKAQTDGTDKWTDKQTDLRRRDRQMNRQTDKQTERLVGEGVDT